MNKTADQRWKVQVRERDKHICQRCHKYDLYIDTHHIASRKMRPDLRHSVDNGVSLCRECHSWAHTHPAEAKKAGLIKSWWDA